MVFVAGIGAVGVAAAVEQGIAAWEHADNQPEPTNGAAAASSTDGSIAPGASQPWSAAVNTVDASVSVDDLEQAIVMFAGDGYFSENPPEGRELRVARSEEITIEEGPGTLALSQAWTEFAADGSLTVYGVFVNTNDDPVRVRRWNTTYLTADGVVLHSQSGSHFESHSDKMVVYPGERIPHQSTFNASDADAFTVSLTDRSHSFWARWRHRIFSVTSEYSGPFA